METTKVLSVQSPAVALDLYGIQRNFSFPTLYREIWLGGFDFDKLRRLADCILFFLEVTGSKAYPSIIWESAGQAHNGGRNVLRTPGNGRAFEDCLKGTRHIFSSKPSMIR